MITTTTTTPFTTVLDGQHGFAIRIDGPQGHVFAYDEATLFRELEACRWSTRASFVVIVRAPESVDQGTATLAFAPDRALHELSATRAGVGIAAWYNEEVARRG